MAHAADQKRHLRLAMEERLQHMNAQSRAAESRSLCRRLLPVIPPGATVCAYVPLPTEPDIRPLLKELILRGDAVFLPCSERGGLQFRRSEELATLLPGPLGILEPPHDAEELDPMQCTIALVPGRAFDHRGNRLGRGNGGFDMWIHHQRKTNPKTRMIGIAFDCQNVHEVPTETHDERMDIIATPRGILNVESNK